MNTQVLRHTPVSSRIVAKRACKIALAATIATFIARVLGLRLPWFATLAAIVTMEITVRTSLRASRDGLLGAAVGAITGLAMALIAKDQTWAVGVVVLIDFVILGMLGFTAAARQAAIVASVIVLIPVSTISTPEFAWVRFAETVIGVVTALLVNLLVFPPRAWRGARRDLARAYRALALMYRFVTDAVMNDQRDGDRVVAQRVAFRAAMRDLDDLWLEAVGDAPGSDALDPSWRPVTYRIWEQCAAMDDVTVDTSARAQLATIRPEIAALAAKTAQVLESAATAFDGSGPLPSAADLDGLRAELLARLRSIESTMVPFDQALQALTFVNAMNVTAIRLADLCGTPVADEQAAAP